MALRKVVNPENEDLVLATYYLGPGQTLWIRNFQQRFFTLDIQSYLGLVVSGMCLGSKYLPSQVSVFGCVRESVSFPTVMIILTQTGSFGRPQLITYP